MAKNIKVAILVGSDSDLPIVQETAGVLESFGIPYDIAIASAHRTPQRVEDFVESSLKKGAEVFIAAAGMSAALPGVVASKTIKPVIGIPIQGKSLNGLDALLSIIQMPAGIPVAAVALDKTGAKNAGLLAVGILALKYPELEKKLSEYREKLSKEVMEKDNELQKIGLKNYIASKGNK
ncbi:MAG: 5-(carboxyamino)imidazole ribonucleotide mutase [Elusimicrobia bacterium]|nr:5-(carboxyamino)imidazole ribonucleotide mutase [Candidatus Liberimonas magnetica]